MFAQAPGTRSSAGSVAAPGGWSGSFLTPGRLLAALAAYYSLQVIIRVTMSTSVDLDESGQVIATQKLSWGYATDPPLYTWIQTAFFQIFGLSVLGLSVLKNLLLFCTCALTYQNARLATRDPQAGIAAALSLFYIASFAWESQRDLTHSVLSATLASATLYGLLQIHLQNRTRWYVWFGVAAGLGLISKFNYAIWLSGLLLASLSLRALRPAILTPRILIPAGIALLIFLPNGLWMLSHRDLAGLTTSKLEMATGSGWWFSARLGLKNLVTAIIAFSAPLALIHGILSVLKPGSQTAPSAETDTEATSRRLLARTWVIIGAMLLAGILVTRATGFKERWFQPILISLPVFVVLLVHRRLGSLQLNVMGILSVAVMLAVSVIMPGRLRLAQRLHREEPLTRPYRQLAGEIRAVLPARSGVVCDTTLLAGNLRLGIPEATWSPPFWTSLFGKSGQYGFVCWDARRSEVMPGELRQWLASRSLTVSSNYPPRIFSGTYRFHDSKQFKIALQQAF
jgi:lipopolysaccharide core galacturonosyltransferase RgtB